MTELRLTGDIGTQRFPIVEFDISRLVSWLDENLPGFGRIQVGRINAGHSNLTYRVSREGHDRAWILRRPPQGELLPTSHDVLREYRVLRILGDSAHRVRVPRVVAACEDPGVIGVPFYLMEEVPGIVVRDRMPSWLGSPGQADRLAGEVIDALAEVHTAPCEALIAARLGRPHGYLGRQLDRWRAQWHGRSRLTGDPAAAPRDLADFHVVADWLARNIPEEQPPAVVHGDYKLDNLVVSRDADGAPRVAAVLDWEMATTGDPRADLGYLLALWPQPGEPTPVPNLVPECDVLPDRAVLAERWQEATGRRADALPWFITLALWKLATVLEMSYTRWISGTADDGFFAEMETTVPRLLARARATCGA